MENIQSTLQFTVSTAVPPLARELIWHVFFSSRARGLSIPAHFPWMDDASEHYCVTALLPGNRIAGTAVLKINEGIEDLRCGMVGLVCVDDSFRGKGVARLIISQLIAFARSLSLDALVLWTRTPEIYVRHGFMTEGQDLYIGATIQQGFGEQLACRAEVWPGQSDIRSGYGLPPYAEQGRRLSSDEAYIIVVNNHAAHTLVDWGGDNKDVADLLQSELPEHFYINSRAHDPLLDVLKTRGTCLDVSVSAWTMTMSLDPNASVSVPWIKFLDRI